MLLTMAYLNCLVFVLFCWLDFQHMAAEGLNAFVSAYSLVPALGPLGALSKVR